MQKLAPSGTFVAEWKGAEPGFYGPRRIASVPTTQFISSIKAILASSSSAPMEECYRFGAAKEVATASLMTLPQSLSILRPIRFMWPIQLTSGYRYLTQNGKFLTKWLVPEWGQPVGFEDLTIDSQAGRLYASSAHLDAVLVFDFKGTRIGSLAPRPPDKLEGPSALALTDRKLYVLNMAGNRISVIDLEQIPTSSR